QLHQGRAALRHPAGKIGQRVTTGVLGIDDGIEPQIDRELLLRVDERHAPGLACAMIAASSRPCSASMIAAAKLPGPCALSAALSPAAPTSTSPAAVARHASASTARHAATSAEAAQPIAVTLAISGWPLAITAVRAPSVTMSRSPVSPTTVARFSA